MVQGWQRQYSSGVYARHSLLLVFKCGITSLPCIMVNIYKVAKRLPSGSFPTLNLTENVHRHMHVTEPRQASGVRRRARTVTPTLSISSQHLQPPVPLSPQSSDSSVNVA